MPLINIAATKVTVYILMAICLIVIFSYLSYEHARNAYLEVGANNGAIESKIQLIKTIDMVTGGLKSCSSYATNKMNILVEVKTTSLHLVDSENESYVFCAEGWPI